MAGEVLRLRAGSSVGSGSGQDYFHDRIRGNVGQGGRVSVRARLDRR